MTTAGIEGETPGIDKAHRPQIHLGDRCSVKAQIGIWLHADDPGHSAIQDKQVPAHRVNGHALRVLQAPLASIIAGKCRRMQMPVGPGHHPDQLLRSRVKEEQLVGLAVESHVDRVADPDRYAHRTSPALDRGEQRDVRDRARLLTRPERFQHQEGVGPR